MKLATWSPEYNTKDVALKKEDNNIVVHIDDTVKNYQPEEIAIIIAGEVETFVSHPQLADYHTVAGVIEATTRILDTVEEFGIPDQNVHVIKYKHLSKGDELVSELKEFQGFSEYATSCDNPTVDTELIQNLQGAKFLLITGLEAHTNIYQLASSLLAHKQAGKLDLEQLVLIDSATKTVTKTDHAKERETWAKYSLEQMGIIVATLYRGDSKLT